jgi:hypothetical protein
MPIEYHRDDRRRLTTVTLIGPCSVEDILGVIDRQAREDTWNYALLYDLRAITDASPDTDVQRIADRVKALGAGRQRGEVGIAIQPRPALFLLGLMYARLTKGFLTVEVLLSAAQIDAWLARNAPSRTPRQP